MNPIPLYRRVCPATLQQGFTLVELMVTLTIFAVLLGIAAPAYTSAVAKLRIKGSVSDFVADLAYARAQAISLRSRVGISVPKPGIGFEQGWTVFRECQDANADNACQDPGEAAEIPGEVGVLDANDEIIRTHTPLLSDIKVCARNSAGAYVAADTITYGGDGRLRVYNAGAEVPTVAGMLFTSPAETSSGARKVLLSSAGRVSVDAAVNPAEVCP